MQYGNELVRQIQTLRDSESLSVAHLRTVRRYVGVMVLTMMSVSGVESVLAVPKETSTEKAEHLRQQANPQLFNNWTFDKDQTGGVPKGFLAVSSGDQAGGEWKVEAQSAAPSSPNVVLGASSCSACVELLVAQGFQYEYPEVVVRIRQGAEATSGQIGVVFGLKDPKNYYATVVDMSQKSIEVVRVIEGKESILGRAAIKSKPVEWHTLRVQRNTIISKDFVETFFDGSLALSVEDQTLGVGQVGILVRGPATARFDNFNASPLYSSRPLSAPAAY